MVALCRVLDCQPGNILEYVPEKKRTLYENIDYLCVKSKL